MKHLLTFLICFLMVVLTSSGLPRHSARFCRPVDPYASEITDSLPPVFPLYHADLTGCRLDHEAAMQSARFYLPASREQWQEHCTKLRQDIMNKSGITVDSVLSFDYQGTGTTYRKGYIIRNFIFQTLPGVYATANIYIPEGRGPFPAVVNLNGHWPGARRCEQVQAVAHDLASNGYVCLCLDAFGAGERSTVPGTEEYHGASLGASLLNAGKSLLGIQVSENIRAVDYLCSLPFVDKTRIGVTGASGGGNQTMWLAAMDERVRAAVPVVSIGSFESYVMESNCVCELLVDGMTLSEEAGILSLVAPRAILMLNHSQELNPTFFPSEMMRTFSNAKPVFTMLGVENNIGYQVFDLPHDYLKEDRKAMLEWFNLHLKGTSQPSEDKSVDFKIVPMEQLAVFKPQNRSPKVKNIGEYCYAEGSRLRDGFLSSVSVDAEKKRKELEMIVRTGDRPSVKHIHQMPVARGWERLALETDDGRMIPLLVMQARNKNRDYVIFCDPKGKGNIAPSVISELKEKGSGIVIVDLTGCGESSSSRADTFDHALAGFHTLSRAELWLGKSVMGEWINELGVVTQFISNRYKGAVITVEANREAGMAALFFSALNPKVKVNLALREIPVSYLFDTREGIDFFSMAIHLPGFLAWGDVSLAVALSQSNMRIIDPVTMSGNRITGEKLLQVKYEFEKTGALCHRRGETLFIE